MRILVLMLLLVGLALGRQTTCPKCLLAEAKQELLDNNSSKALGTLETAVAQFETSGKNDPDQVEALVMLDMYLHWAYRSNLEGWKTQIKPGVQEALTIAEAHPEINSEILALALELQADVLGRSEVGLPFWLKAQKIRAARVAAIAPEQKQDPSALAPVQIKGAVVAPRLKTKVEPQYPALARHAGLECSNNLLRIVIDSDGVPEQFQILQGCGYGFDEQAVNAVKQWRFIPSSFNGAPVATVAQVQVNFRLESGANGTTAPIAPPAPDTGKRVAELIQHGREALSQQDYRQAEKDFDESTKFDPANLYAWNNLGLAYFELRQIDKAEAAFRRQIEINATDPWAYANLGRVLVARGDFPAALEAFHKQIAITADDKAAHLYLARMLETQAKWDEALPEAQKATELTPTNWTAWAALGRAQAHSGKPDQARKSFNKALDVNDSTTAQGTIAYSMLDANLDPERAWQLVSSALTVASGQICTPHEPVQNTACALKLTHLAYLLHTAGRLLFKQGKIDEAQPYLESSYAIAPHPGFALNLATLYAKQGLNDAALRFCAIAQLSPALEAEENTEIKTQFDQRRLAALPKNSLAAGYVSSPQTPMTPGKLTVLVDPNGKILAVQAEGAGSISPAQISQVQEVKLRPLAWPGHALMSVRTIELRPVGKGSIVVSYVEPPLELSPDEEPPLPREADKPKPINPAVAALLHLFDS